MILVDTNVLLYAVSALPEDAAKRGRARSLLTEDDLGVSVQVLPVGDPRQPGACQIVDINLFRFGYGTREAAESLRVRAEFPILCNTKTVSL